MGFPSVAISSIYPDPYHEKVLPLSGERPPKEQVLQSLHVSTCFEQLGQVLQIRKKAEQIFNRIFSDCQLLNDRLATIDGRMQELKEQAFGMQKLMESHSPESFMSTAADEIVSLVHKIPGGLFNRSTSPADVNVRREQAEEIIPLYKFNRFWPCLEMGVTIPANSKLDCSHAYSKPRIFFDRWVEDQSNWRSQQDENNAQILKMFQERRAKEIEEASEALITPIERNYVDDMGRNYVKKIGKERDLGSYNRVEDRLLKRDKSTKQLVYGSGVVLEDLKVDKEEAYQLREVADSDEMPNFDPSQEKRLSELPVPNLPPVNMPLYSESFDLLLDKGITPGGSPLEILDDGLPLLKKHSMKVIDMIRKGSQVGHLRPNLIDRTLPRLPEDPDQSDVVYSGMKERFQSRAEEEGTFDLPRLPSKSVQSASLVLDAPPLPSRTPPESYKSADQLQSTSVSGEIEFLPDIPSTPPDSFQPGSLRAEEFYKSDSYHPVPPIPPPSLPDSPTSI